MAAGIFYQGRVIFYTRGIFLGRGDFFYLRGPPIFLPRNRATSTRPPPRKFNFFPKRRSFFLKKMVKFLFFPPPPLKIAFFSRFFSRPHKLYPPDIKTQIYPLRMRYRAFYASRSSSYVRVSARRNPV